MAPDNPSLAAPARNGLPQHFIASARYVLLPLASAITGYTVKAMLRKIERGDWPEGRVWIRAPDRHIMIDVLGYQKWVEGSR